nr:myosin-11-like [Aegilops tauschii subsp. strangulata]
MRQQETLLMTREDVMARETRLADRKALLDAREREISLQEEKLEGTLRAKDDELEALVQEHTKELEDKHKAAMDALTINSAMQLKKITDDLAAAFAAKTNLDRQVTKLIEELAESTKEVEALKEEARKMEARIGTLESAAESSELRQQQLTKDLNTTQRLWKDAEDKLANQSEQANLWIRSMVYVAMRLAAQTVAMGMEGPVYSGSKQETPSAKLGVLFNELIDKLKAHEEGKAERFATKSRKLADDALLMVLSNIACRHPDLDLDDGFRKPLAGTDISATKEKAALRAAKVLHVPKASSYRQAK